MVLGMLVLEPLWPTVHGVELQALVMATNMTIGMTALMAVRRHAWPGIVEMSAAMYAPFIILFVPYRTGLITADGLFLLGHLLMLPAMLLAMLHRRAEYTAAHTTHHSGRRPATSTSPADISPGDGSGRGVGTGAAEPGYFTGATTHAPAQHS